ncbi:WD40 repeat-like protein, partial [Imleria badia]
MGQLHAAGAGYLCPLTLYFYQAPSLFLCIVDGMQSTGTGRSGIIEINSQHEMCAVLFAEDGKQVLGGASGGLVRRWQVDDGREVGEPIRTGGEHVHVAALSPDRKSLACGLWSGYGRKGVEVWDAKAHKEILDIKGQTSSVCAVDFSPDSTKLATGTYDYLAFIWSMATGEMLIGPLQHDGYVVTVRFSPTGDRFATASGVENPDLGAKAIRIYNSENGVQLLNIPGRIRAHYSKSLAWSPDGRQLFSASYNEVKCFDSSSGSLLSQWSVPGGTPASISLSYNKKFIVVSAGNSLSFWDTSTHQQIGSDIKHARTIFSFALSPNDHCIATGELGKLTLRSLHGILPSLYLTVNLPFMCIDDAEFKSWTQGDLTRVEQLLTKDIADPSLQALAFAQRSLVRSRLKRWDMAMDDAKMSTLVQRSVIGYIANAVARIGNGDHESAIRVFDLVFTDGLATDNNFLLLIKAIIVFECGKHHDAISRVDDLIDIVDDKSLYITVRAQMSLLLAGMLLNKGDYDRAMELLVRARDAIPFQSGARLVVISLIFGWDFDRLDVAIRLQLQGCIKPFEDRGDAAVYTQNPNEAILQYSSALSLNPSNTGGLLVKRSKARAMIELWEEALKDANDAIEADSQSPWGYERRHAALHGLQRYDEAMDAFTRMLSLIEGSVDQDIR